MPTRIGLGSLVPYPTIRGSPGALRTGHRPPDRDTRFWVGCGVILGPGESHMRRRDFVALLGGAAAVWPRAARAQQTAMPVVGLLRSTSLADAAHLVAGFRQGLKETGFVEGQNVAIEYRSAEDQADRLSALA